MSSWLQYPTSRPRRSAHDGVRARSRRGQIAESWWSRRFLAVLESLTIANRLNRGRSYARSGQVSELSVTGGWVTASVQGSRGSPYDVWIQVPRLSEAEWGRIEGIMASEARLLAALLTGEMPEDIEEVFASAGVSLFPSSRGELAMECSCPDYANPCKHVAASFYILAEAFDRDPFLIFEWRGRGREALLRHLRKRRAEITEAGAEGGPDLPGLPTSAESFWGDAWAADIGFEPALPEVPEALLLALDPAPVHPDGADVTEILAAAYRQLGAAAELVGGWSGPGRTTPSPVDQSS